MLVVNMMMIKLLLLKGEDLYGFSTSIPLRYNMYICIHLLIILLY